MVWLVGWLSAVQSCLGQVARPACLPQHAGLPCCFALSTAQPALDSHGIAQQGDAAQLEQLFREAPACSARQTDRADRQTDNTGLNVCASWVSLVGWVGWASWASPAGAAGATGATGWKSWRMVQQVVAVQAVYQVVCADAGLVSLVAMPLLVVFRLVPRISVGVLACRVD